MKVLILDDDPDIRNLIDGVVTSMGMESIPAGDGQEALKLCIEREPDLAVLDLMVPGISGAEVCRSIKSTEEGRLIPVLIVTAVSELDNKVDLLDSGADDYVTKPFNVRELRARINALLRVRSLSLSLKEKNNELKAAQAKLIASERQLAAVQLAGSAAHALGQPLTAMKLNCHLLEILPHDDEKFKKAFAAIKSDLDRMAKIIEGMKKVNADEVEEYHQNTKIMKVSELEREK